MKDHDRTKTVPTGNGQAQEIRAEGAEPAADATPGAPSAPGADGSGATQELDPLQQARTELEGGRILLADQKDQYLRLLAEFENFKKRMYRDQAENLKYAQLPLLKELTGAMDNLHRALEHTRKVGGQEAASLVAGIELVAKQIGDTFERFGMVRVKAAGAPFDPTRHEAVSVVETDEVPENHVLQEFQPGYVLHERVVRPAMVSVAKRGLSNGSAEPPKN